MEIKHTVEILTKDIQEIEKLVRNLSNFPSPPQIELDLAMSKLRNVYDLLYTISADLKKDAAKDIRAAKDESPVQVLEVVKPVEPEVTETKPVDELENQDQAPIEKIPEPVAVPEPIPEPKQEPLKEFAEPAPPQPDHRQEPQPDPAKETAPIEEKAVDNTEVQQTANKEVKEKKEAEILAEKFAKDSSLNERIAKSGQSDLSSKLSSEPIDSIKRNIGINDRFLIIRELMNGDNDAYNELVQKLDASQNFNEAFAILENKFDDLEHEGARMLVNLARRKYISKENV